MALFVTKTQGIIIMKTGTTAVKEEDVISIIASLKVYDLIIFPRKGKPLRKHRQTASQFSNSSRKGSIH